MENTLNENLHYTVYFKHFLKWKNLGIFNDLFDIVVRITQKFNNCENFFIDTSIFRNIGGIGDTSYTYKIKSKKGTKVSILVDSKGNPLSIHCVSANVSDICLVIPSIIKIKDNDSKIKIKNLIGDKGYVSKKIKN